MEMNDIFKKILEEIMQAYSSFESPNYNFVQKRYSQQPYKEIKSRLEEFFNLEELTDLNEDVSCVWRIWCKDKNWLLQLSLIGRFGFLIRLNGKGEFEYVIETLTNVSDADEEKIVSIIHNNGILLLGREFLEKEITWKEYNGTTEHVALFRILFSDIETLPWHTSG